MKAQFLVKISNALSPQNLDFSDYDTRFYIPRSLPKPGIELATPENYGLNYSETPFLPETPFLRFAYLETLCIAIISQRNPAEILMAPAGVTS